MIIDNKAYIANVGDSRAIMSAYNGQVWYKLSKDHKPDDPDEKQRIEGKGGKIYQSQLTAKAPFQQYHDSNTIWTKIGLFPSQQLKFAEDWEYLLIGPYRVHPGRLSVWRTFGDIEAKFSEFGGMDGIIICDPDIKEFDISDSVDFVILGWDGIFDKLTNSQVLQAVWKEVHQNTGSIHQLTGHWVEGILKTSAASRTLDNITTVMVSFKSLKKTLSKLNKVKHGLTEDSLDQIYNEFPKGDLRFEDIDTEYMQEILSWRKNNSRRSSKEERKDNRDASVPVSRRRDYSFIQDKIPSSRYLSNARNRANYHRFKQSSKFFENTSNVLSQNLQKSHPPPIISFGGKKFSNDVISEIRNLRNENFRSKKGMSGEFSPKLPQYPIKTKRLELFPKEKK
jgi:serine/threonine protein phosphatase PrpC